MALASNRREFLRRAAALIPLMHSSAFLTSNAGAMQNAQTPSSPRAQRGRFARLRLRSHKLQETAEFYRTTIGLPVSQNDDQSAAVQCGATAIEFQQAEPDTQPFYHFAFNIPHNKLDHAIKWMEGRAPLVQRQDGGGVVFHFPGWDAHAIYFFDPSGNIVEFIARHTLKNEAAGDFGVQDILYVSEIGVVTPDVRDTSVHIRAALKIEQYRPAGDEFSAVGDEHGLFIVVKTGRKWFASDLTAQVFPAEAVMRDLQRDPITLNESSFTIRR